MWKQDILVYARLLSRLYYPAIRWQIDEGHYHCSIHGFSAQRSCENLPCVSIGGAHEPLSDMHAGGTLCWLVLAVLAPGGVRRGGVSPDDG